MDQMRIDVMTQNYNGSLIIEAVKKDLSLFSIYREKTLIGHLQPLKTHSTIHWYSYNINDKELLEQIGEWIEYLYVLN